MPYDILCAVSALEEEFMNSMATWVVVDRKKSTAADVTIAQSDQAPVIEAPEISRGAWKAIIFLMVGAALFLATLGAYVLFALHRFQDCL